ncbi:MAG: 4-hydroxy-tetrahydrodipicolinate synthase [Treponema sp.]|jgi:4-hydroxy-tetrahydrodipicolinate synthase|nr:4-hydroxy-tetrahydrodipicolinate synthase [Treponema sp.]
MIQFKGAYTALITPMRENGRGVVEIDYDGFRRLINFQLEGGIDGLVPLGTTGESPVLERDEQDRLIQIALEVVKGRVPVIIGTGSNSTKHTIENTKRAKALGADAALVVTPYYNKPNDEGLIRHVEAVAHEADFPIILYNIASRTGKNITAPVMERLSRIPHIVGVKEASGDVNQMGDIIRDVAGARKAEGKAFAVFSGDDALTLPLLALGGDGIISVISNLVPGKVAALVRACGAGNFEEGRKIHYELLPLIKAAFIETNPIPIKTALSWVGLPGGPLRLPLGPLDQQHEAPLRAALAGLGMEIRAVGIDPATVKVL